MVTVLPNEMVKVPGIGTMNVSRWMNQNRAAIRIMRECVGKPATERGWWAVDWLKANGIHSEEDFSIFEKNIQALGEMPDPSKIIRCRKCHLVLTDPVSKAYGMGPDCRSGGAEMRRRHAEFERTLAPHASAGVIDRDATQAAAAG